MTLYVNLAEVLGTRIEQGFYRPGDRLPSVRALSVEHGVSLSTVQQAYRLLEDNGLAMPKPKSGYFVPVGRELPALPEIGRPAQRPVEISQWDQVLELIRAVPRKDVIQMGRGMPDVLSPTLKPLLRSLAGSVVARICPDCITTTSLAVWNCASRSRVCLLIPAANSTPKISSSLPVAMRHCPPVFMLFANLGISSQSTRQASTVPCKPLRASA